MYFWLGPKVLPSRIKLVLASWSNGSSPGITPEPDDVCPRCFEGRLGMVLWNDTRGGLRLGRDCSGMIPEVF